MMASRRRGRFAADPLVVIAAGFALIILLGSVLLSLPCAARSGRSVGFFDALFTSTSAVCVTGLCAIPARPTASSGRSY